MQAVKRNCSDLRNVLSHRTVSSLSLNPTAAEYPNYHLKPITAASHKYFFPIMHTHTVVSSPTPNCCTQLLSCTDITTTPLQSNPAPCSSCRLLPCTDKMTTPTIKPNVILLSLTVGMCLSLKRARAESLKGSHTTQTTDHTHRSVIPSKPPA